MKKVYLLAGVILAFSSLQAQTTVDFEDLTLPKVDTFYNGSDNAGTFTSKGVAFNVNYDDTYGMWLGGFAYSNMRDDSTADFSNNYSAYPAIGTDSSEIYALNTSGDTLFFPSPSDLVSVELTNTTYVYLSMKNGDAYGKQFGSPNDANGDPDGTQGKDYFFIRIYSHFSNGELLDSLDFYLADFTSNNATEHYIVDTWKEVDLSAMKIVSYLTFKYFSSDNGTYGINTPTFFALDNLVFNESTTSLSTEKLAAFKVFPNPANSHITINGGQGIYAIYNINSEELLKLNNNGSTNLDISGLQSGLYFVRNINHPSITQKLIIQ